MKRIVTLAFVLMFSALSQAQIDTLFAESQLDFYPLNVGDVRHYKYTGYHVHIGREESYFAEKVLKDTMINGLNYKKIVGQYNFIRYERIDSLSYRVYKAWKFVDGFIESRILKLDAQHDSLGYTCSISYKLISGNVAKVKLFTSRDEYTRQEDEIAAKLGYTKRYYYGGDMSTNSELIYALINGVKYGTPAPSDELPDEPTLQPNDFTLYQNYQNPFNSTTKILFNLTSAVNIQLEIYNTLGQRVLVILDEERSEEDHTIEFDGKNFSSGIYLNKLSTENFTQVKKMILIK